MKKKIHRFIIIFIFGAFDIYLPAPAGNEVDVIDETLRSVDPFIQEFVDLLRSYVKQPLWQHTRMPGIRDVLYLMPHEFTTRRNGELAVNFFYNEVPDMKTTVGNLLQENAIEDKDTILSYLPDPQNKSAVIPLFKKITLQERRIGFFVRAGLKRGPVSTQLLTSLFIDERNCWLGVRNRSKLLSYLQVDESSIPKKEFYKLKFGIGDTRLALGLDNLEAARWKLHIGLQAIVPTSKFSYAPKYESNVESIINASDIDELKQAAMDIVRNIRNYLIDPRFGNSGHFGIGLYFEPRANFFHEQLHLWGRLSFDALFAASEDRLFFFKQTLSTNDALNYLEQYVFPSSFNVRVCPSGIFNLVLAASTDIRSVQLTLGYDFYTQQQEHIKKMNHSLVKLQDLNVKAAESLKILQHKIFTEALYQNGKPFSIGVGGDVTVASANIGKDWTAYLKTTLLF